MNSAFTRDDQKFMNLAINLAKRNVGKTKENPSVGCVITKNNIILSTGTTDKNGRPHGENIAIQNCKEDLSGATLYVTLEPCSHFGKTEPCVDLIINKKISRIVIACQDPDPRVNGKAIEKLKNSGVKTEVGLLENEAKEVNRGFFKSKLHNQPFVTLKLATSKNGKIANKGDSRVWITNEQSRKYGHYLRFRNDAILVGANTVRIDNPTLDCRIAGLELFSPIRIILSKNLDLDLKSIIFQDQDKLKTYIATSSSNEDRIQEFTRDGIEVISFRSLDELLNKICEIGINNLLIEGGSKASSSFLKENLVDEIYHFQGNKILEENAIDAIAGLDIQETLKDLAFKKKLSKNINDDLLIIYSKS
jgi:diaminohydroxyphosphoribosylaminopyrimidine deaminase/5-amino-6-(5-phosphoribosylamino)uracil reductase